MGVEQVMKVFSNMITGKAQVFIPHLVCFAIMMMRQRIASSRPHEALQIVQQKCVV